MFRFQAESTVAHGAESVYVVAVVMMSVMIVTFQAETILPVSAAVLESVQQVMFLKKGECAEDAAAVHRRQQILHIGQ